MLMRALAVSLLAHALLLVGVVRTMPPGMEAPSMPVQVVIRRDAAPAAASHIPSPVAKTPPEKPAVASAEPRPRKNAPERRIMAEQPAISPLSVPVTAPGGGQDAVASGAAAVAAATGAKEPGSTGADLRVAPAVSSVPGAGVNADDVRHFRTMLAIGAKRFKHYPALARERGWEGTAEVAVDFRRMLPEPEIALAVSSGRKVLDDQALEMIRRSVRLTGVPAGMKGKDFRVLMPVTFSLEEDG